MYQKLIGKNVIIRTFTAGVHFGTLKDITEDGKGCILENSRNAWYWSGAAGLSQMATEGVTDPDNCKFTVTIPTRVLTEVIEILPLTDVAFTNLNAVKEWKR